MDESTIYQEEHRRVQDKMGSRKLADRQEALIVHDTFTTDEINFISTREMFFLSTLNSRGEPTVSFKGGPTGFISVRDNELVFPNYDGNGMYLSVGNLISHPKVGLLFIDLETPRRLRVQGTAKKDDSDEALNYPGAEFLIRIVPTTIWVNCPRYIPRYEKVADSAYLDKSGPTERFAQWKRLDSVTDSLSEKDRDIAVKEGLLTIESYHQKISHGDG